MSPALTNRFAWYPRLPGNRQIGRSLHFLVMCAFVLFVLGHVAMGAITGFVRNMNHIVVGADDTSLTGVYLGLVGVGVIVAVNALANWAAWRQPRFVQHVAKAIVTPVMGFLLDRPAPQAEFRREDISPFFWANGKVPTCEDWLTLAANDFKDYRLKVYGLVENPVELSLEDLRGLGTKTQITLHHCIQGWSGIAEWGGVPLEELGRLVRPKANAVAVVFYSFGEGGEFYDSLSMANALHPQTLLAYEMNYEPLGERHGAPLRLGVRTSSASRWSSGFGPSSSLKAASRSARGRAATTRTTSTSASWPTSEENHHATPDRIRQGCPRGGQGDGGAGALRAALWPGTGPAGAGQAPRLADQRLCLLHRHAHQGCARPRRD
jgi:hypothetical protein